MEKSLRYVYGIDAIRFVSALFVAVFHLTYRNADVAWMMPVGWVGVQIFFVISGVVIANSASAPGTTPLRFATSRALRLYPAAWIAALVNGALLLLVARPVYQELGINVIPQLGAFLRSLVLFADYFLASAYWTLPIELAFYGIVLLSLAFGGRARLRGIARGLVLVSCPYLLALSLHERHVIDAPWLDLGYGLKNALLVRHGPYFALGIFISLWKDGQRLGAVDRAAIAAALLLAGLEITSRGGEIAGLIAGGGPAGQFGQAFLATTGCAIFYLFLAAICASVLYSERLVPPASGRAILRTAGLMTYPFYLLHEAVGGALLHALADAGMPFGMKVMIALLGVGVAAYAVAALAEPLVRRALKACLDRFLAPRAAGKAV